MSDSYMPADDAGALSFMTVFAAGLTANTATYMVSSADALAVTNSVNLFAAALAITDDPATKTKVTVAAKDDARIAAEQIVRQYVSLIKPNAGISDPDKIAIGVRPVNTSRDPINPPSSSPLLNIIGATPLSQTIRYADTTTPDSGAKPFGALQLQLFVAVGEEEADDPAAAQFYGAFTKNPIGVQFAAEEDGKVATYFGRWVTRKGLIGPWSLPISMRIAA